MVTVLGSLTCGVGGREAADGTDHAFVNGLLEGKPLGHILGIHRDLGSLLRRVNRVPLPEQRYGQRLGSIGNIRQLALAVGGDADRARIVNLESDARERIPLGLPDARSHRRFGQLLIDIGTQAPTIARLLDGGGDPSAHLGSRCLPGMPFELETRTAGERRCDILGNLGSIIGGNADGSELGMRDDVLVGGSEHRIAEKLRKRLPVDLPTVIALHNIGHAA